MAVKLQIAWTQQEIRCDNHVRIPNLQYGCPAKVIFEPFFCRTFL